MTGLLSVILLLATVMVVVCAIVVALQAHELQSPSMELRERVISPMRVPLEGLARLSRLSRRAQRIKASMSRAWAQFSPRLNDLKLEASRTRNIWTHASQQPM